ncbi:ferredoxin [Candidatus Pacearchaeota archaeon]|nr:ferredoxin [Candidatus Pacearchaeota archaeon]
MVHKIVVDQDKCIGCGACEAICPDSFKMSGGKARTVKAEVEELTCEKEAVSECPVDAISVS